MGFGVIVRRESTFVGFGVNVVDLGSILGDLGVNNCGFWGQYCGIRGHCLGFGVIVGFGSTFMGFEVNACGIWGQRLWDLGSTL